ncbi:MAG: TrbI/VirB10 family protein [Pelagibaca sp.]
MSANVQPDLEKRLEALERSSSHRGTANRRRGPLMVLLAVALAAGALLYLVSSTEEKENLPTATPDEFQSLGDGFGAIEPFVPPPPPDPEIVLVAPEPVEPDADLLARIAVLQAQVEEVRNAPRPTLETDTAATETVNALSDQLADLQATSERAQKEFREALANRDRTLQQLRMDLDLARLEANRPGPAPAGPTEEMLRAQQEEARRLAEDRRRTDEERAFQERRIMSSLIAFGAAGGTDGGESALTERRLGEITDFVMNGAMPSAVTQAEIIANPSNTVVQGTMIQAVMETALDSSLPGQTRAIVSEDVFSHDGSRLLIPRGARLIGRYRSDLELAQHRVTIAWDRIILPGDQSLRISAFGGDALGRSGVSGFVDTRFGTRFGSAALISIIAAVPSVTAAQTENERVSEVLQNVGEDLTRSTQSVIGAYLSISPVIHVDQGAPVTVMVDRDLEIF